jgi:hypothetical protein
LFLILSSLQSNGLFLVGVGLIAFLSTSKHMHFGLKKIVEVSSDFRPSPSPLLISLAGILGAVIVSLPYAITDRHQAWCGHLLHCVYLDSRVSFFFFSLMLFGVLLNYLDSPRGDHKGRGLRVVTLSLITGLLASITFVNNFVMGERMTEYVEPWRIATISSCWNLDEYSSISLNSLIDPDNTLSVHTGFDMDKYWNLFRQSRLLSKDSCQRESGDPFFPLNRYDASLEQGFDLRRSGLPKFLVSASGLSVIEAWGRWSDFNLSPEVTLVFAEDLPKEFTLQLTLMGFGPNVGEDMLVSVGESEYRVSVPSELQKVTIDIATASPTRVISISAPFPTSPLDLSLSEDSRKIGLGFSNIRIIDLVKNE